MTLEAPYNALHYMKNPLLPLLSLLALLSTATGRAANPPLGVEALSPAMAESSFKLPAPAALREAVSHEEAKRLFDHLLRAPLAPGERPLPWKYPSDGCYARATLAALELERLGVYSDKIFIEGDLRFPTRFADDGRCARWRYHIAPILYVRHPRVRHRHRVVAYVLDPTLFDRPVPYRTWLLATVPSGTFCGFIAPRSRPDAAAAASEKGAEGLDRGCFAYITPRFHAAPADVAIRRGAWVANELDSARAAIKELSELEEYTLKRLQALPYEEPYCKR